MDFLLKVISKSYKTYIYPPVLSWVAPSRGIGWRFRSWTVIHLMTRDEHSGNLAFALEYEYNPREKLKPLLILTYINYWIDQELPEFILFSILWYALAAHKICLNIYGTPYMYFFVYGQYVLVEFGSIVLTGGTVIVFCAIFIIISLVRAQI